MKTVLKTASMVALTLAVAACSKGLSGTYADKNRMLEMEFKSKDTVVVKALGAGTELKYELEDKSVKLDSPQGKLVLPIREDGCIAYPMIGSLCKQ